MSTAILTFDYNLFITQIPAYSDPTKYPEATLQVWWDIAINYVSDVGNCGSLQGSARQYAINLMMAHLIYLSLQIAANQVPGMMQGATIDKVSVNLVPPPVPNQWQWWLGTSPYGQQLLALLQAHSAGGYYIGGSPTMAGFRWGTFGRGGGCC